MLQQRITEVFLLLLFTPLLVSAQTVKCPRYVGIKGSSDRLAKNTILCFKKKKDAQNAGFTDPVPRKNFGGTWAGTVPLLSDNCDTVLGFPPQRNSVTDRYIVQHSANELGAALVTNFPPLTGYGKPPTNKSFNLTFQADTTLWCDTATQSGSFIITSVFSNIQGNNATLNTRLTVFCPKVNPAQSCESVWEGPITRIALPAVLPMSAAKGTAGKGVVGVLKRGLEALINQSGASPGK